MIWVILISIAVAGILDAVRDTLAHHRSTSVFKNASSFWTQEKGWFLPLTKYKVNAWHICETLMIFIFTIPVVLLWNWLPFGIGIIDFGIKWAVCGLLYNLPFNLFYNKILRK